ncbi:MAG: hypothetical protein AMJ75_01160 [Phycisphaerae bacterium SM1_79]|nr:MAG: hypothetical protein AMJ75_01160 [Phycisphaerae bacterium SM1_79]
MRRAQATNIDTTNLPGDRAVFDTEVFYLAAGVYLAEQPKIETPTLPIRQGVNCQIRNFAVITVKDAGKGCALKFRTRTRIRRDYGGSEGQHAGNCRVQVDVICKDKMLIQQIRIRPDRSQLLRRGYLVGIAHRAVAGVGAPVIAKR